ncbi:hypothetical protein BVY01_03155 [bacterium I07]|nr:hypothetical protein BVY01_03155 [bacterium I07]
MDEISNTMWAVSGPWFLIWGILGVPVGALVAFIGMLLHSGARGSTVWKYGLGGFLVLAFSMSIGFIGHHPPVFGLGGTVILLCFIGILWLWSKERMVLKGVDTLPVDLRLAAYMFFVIGAWFTCGMAGFPFLKAFDGESQSTPLHIMVLFVVGWLLLFLSHYKSSKILKK